MSDTTFGGNARNDSCKPPGMLAEANNKKRKIHTFMIMGKEVSYEQFCSIKSNWRK